MLKRSRQLQFLQPLLAVSVAIHNISPCDRLIVITAEKLDYEAIFRHNGPEKGQHTGIRHSVTPYPSNEEINQIIK